MTDPRFTVVVVGAGYGGTMAAARLANLAGGRARVLVLDRASELVERIRLHQVVAGQRVPGHRYDRLFAGGRIEFRRSRVLGIDAGSRVVRFDAGYGVETVRYDRLVLAAGSGDARARVPGAREHGHAIATPEAAAALRAALEALPAGGRLVVCGGGSTAIETASELAEARAGLSVSVVAAGGVGDFLSQRGRRHVLGALAERSVRVLEGARITAVAPGRLERAGGRPIPFDVAIWASGFVASPLAASAGVAVSAEGQMLVDRTLRSVSHPDVYGAGDAACVERLEGGVTTRMACATALPMGAHSAQNIAREIQGLEPLPFRFAYRIQCLSLGRRDGLIQFVRDDDSPTKRVLVGGLAAVVKELICRYAVVMLRVELRGLRAFRWPSPATRELVEREALS